MYVHVTVSGGGGVEGGGVEGEEWRGGVERERSGRGEEWRGRRVGREIGIDVQYLSGYIPN